MSSISIDSTRIKDGLYTGTQEEAKSDLETIQTALTQKGFRSGYLHLVRDNKGGVQFERKSFFQRWREGSATTKQKDDETAAFVTSLMERAYGKPSSSTLRSSLATRNSSFTTRDSSLMTRDSSLMMRGSSMTTRESAAALSSFAPALPYRRLTAYLTRTDNRLGTQGLLGILKQSARDHKIREIKKGLTLEHDELEAFFKSRGMFVSQPEKNAPDSFKRTQRWFISLDRAQESFNGSLFSFHKKEMRIDDPALTQTINANELTVIQVKDAGSSSFYSVPKGKGDDFVKQVSGQRRATLHLIGTLSRMDASPQRSSRPSFYFNQSRSSDTLSTITSTTRNSSPMRDSSSTSERGSRSTFSSFLRRSPSPKNDWEKDSITYEGYSDPNAQGGLNFRPIRTSESIQKNRTSLPSSPSSPKSNRSTISSS